MSVFIENYLLIEYRRCVAGAEWRVLLAMNLCGRPQNLQLRLR